MHHTQATAPSISKLLSAKSAFAMGSMASLAQPTAHFVAEAMCAFIIPTAHTFSDVGKRLSVAAQESKPCFNAGVFVFIGKYPIH